MDVVLLVVVAAVSYGAGRAHQRLIRAGTDVADLRGKLRRAKTVRRGSWGAALRGWAALVTVLAVLAVIGHAAGEGD